MIVLIKDGLSESWIEHFCSLWQKEFTEKLLVSEGSSIAAVIKKSSNITLLCRRDADIDCESLKYVAHIHLLSAGRDGFSYCNCFQGRLTTSSGVNSRSIAEYLIGVLLLESKGFLRARESQLQERWERYWCTELQGQKVLVVGFGNIAKDFIKLSKPFNLEIRVANRTVYDNQILPIDDVHLIANKYDTVISTIPYSIHTESLFNQRFFDNFGDGLFINVSRGEVVHEESLLNWLDQDMAARKAILDVFEAEPLPPSNQLWLKPNVFLTPHIAGTTNFYMENLLRIIKRTLV